MFYENELRFLCEIFKKNRVRVTFASPSETIAKVIDNNMEKLLIGESQKELTIFDVFGEIKPYTIYKFSNSYRLYCLFLLLPQTQTDTLVAVGPYLDSKVDNRFLFELCEKYNIRPDKQKMLKDYYASIPVLCDSDPIFSVIYTFAERIWGGRASYTVVDTTADFSALPYISSKVTDDSNHDLLLNMKLMEQRYAYEDELMTAVSMGNDHKVARILSTLSPENFDKRVSDSLRNLKNYSIVMNTLLRKAAQQGGVHPLYLDDISSRYAVSIEQASSIEGIQSLMSEMAKAYCRLVRKHSTKQYSSTVQKTIALIDYDLSSSLSLSSLAQSQNISSGYLATIFKKETGKTVTEFVIDRRMAFAMRLLSTTRLQVQTVALHCGVMDVQYFSKIFKKKTGKTPKEYRESVKMQNKSDTL